MKKLSSGSTEKVEEIEDKAMSLGWSEELLYGNNGKYTFPCGPGHGLVCHLREADAIGEVKEHSIEIILPSGTVQKYYR